MIAYKIIVKGKVQGVFYRANTLQKAKSLKLNGTVCNLKNGDVLIIAEGLKKDLDELILWCKTGPRLAVVENVIVEDIKPQGFADFKITH
ncbi:MAG: acylphosphatase [Bacteroidetes bacterium]|nr:acylphosphatase [Bacteroidota bacterium]